MDFEKDNQIVWNRRQDDKIMRIFFTILISMVLVVGVSVSSSLALPFYGNQGLEGLGSFTGELTYTANNDKEATLTVELTNTSPEANEGFITAFAFNNPFNNITDVSLSSTDDDFNLIGGLSFDNSISAEPFGDFDIGASITNGWLGEGIPQPGIGVGSSAEFTFSLTGTGLSFLSAEDFFNEFSAGSNSGQSQAFAVRFRGFDNDDGSDKVPGAPGIPDLVIPEPATVLLLGIGLMSLVALTRKHRKN